MTISDRIKRRREELNMSQEELAYKLGYKSRSSVNKIEKNAHGLPQSKIKAIAEALQTTPSYIMGWVDELKQSEECETKSTTTKLLPLLKNISCNEPNFSNEDKALYIEAEKNIEADFYIKTNDDSMIGARIYNGDIVFIRRQPAVKNGEIALVIINGETTLKRVYYYSDHNKLVLQSENPKFQPYVFVGQEVNNIKILGKAVAFQSNII